VGYIQAGTQEQSFIVHATIKLYISHIANITLNLRYPKNEFMSWIPSTAGLNKDTIS